MAFAYISEYTRIPAVHGGALNVEDRPIATQRVTYTTATNSAAFNAKTKWVRINVASVAHISHDGAATASSPRYAADTTTYMVAGPDDTLSFYDGTS